MNNVELVISGLKVLIEVEDVQLLVDYSWHKHYNKTNNTYYMRGWNKVLRKKEMMHRVIMNAQANEQVDHINGNTLDNRRCNLRLCSHGQNIVNRKTSKSNTSGYKGVSKSGHKWLSNISFDGKRVYLGVFETKEKAAQAYNQAATKYHGDFAVLNNVKSGGLSDE